MEGREIQLHLEGAAEKDRSREFVESLGPSDIEAERKKWFDAVYKTLSAKEGREFRNLSREEKDKFLKERYDNIKNSPSQGA